MPESRPQTEAGHRAYLFGGFQLDIDRGELSRDGRPIGLRPKSFHVLRILVQDSGRLLTRRELLDRAWGRSAISDDCLSQCLVDIRKALGDDKHRMIRTLPRRGYIFEVPVTQRTIVAAPETPPLAPGRSRVRLVAAAAMLMAAMAVALSALESIPAKDQLPDGVPHAAPSDAHAQRRLAEHFYERRSPGDLDRAERHYRAALEQDSSIAAAWVGLAAIANVRMDEGLITQRDGLAVMGPAVKRALALAPGMAEAHLRACCYYEQTGELGTAAAHCETAARLEPGNPRVLTFAAGRAGWSGNFERSIELWQAALRLEPSNTVTRWNFAYVLTAASRYPEAEQQLRRLIELRPDGDGKVRTALAALDILQGRADEAIATLESLPAGRAERDQALAMAYHSVGRDSDSAAALARLVESGVPGGAARIAEVHAWRGETEQARFWLDEARRVLLDADMDEPENATADTIRFSPFLRSLHDDPSWTATVALVTR